MKTPAHLIHNSKAAMMAAVEIHNKPLFSYRYEVCSLLVINAWELLLKAFLQKEKPELRIQYEDGTSMTFEKCISNVQSILGKDFMSTAENLSSLYEYRCNVMHYYEERIDTLLFALLSKGVLNYADFIRSKFSISLADESNLFLLPIGFSSPVSPLDFLTNKSSIENSSDEVKAFIKSLCSATQRLAEEGIDDTVLLTFNMAVVNERRVKNADIIAAITKSETEASVMVVNQAGPFTLSDDINASKVRLDEETIYETLFPYTYQDVIDYAIDRYSDFKINPRFHDVMKSLKIDPNYFRNRFLDARRRAGVAKGYYSFAIFRALDGHYTVRPTAPTPFSPQQQNIKVDN